MKTCTKCKIEKPLDEFDFRNDSKNYRPYCIDCRRKRDREYNIRIGKNKGVRAYNKKLKSQNLKHCKSCNTIQSRDNFDCANNKPSGKISHCKKCRKEYTEKNKEIISKKAKQYYKNNRKSIIKKNGEYTKKNLERINKYYEKRRQKEPLFKLKCNLRSRTSSAFKRKRWIKNSRNIEMLGCTYEEAFKHIENQFTKGMSWDNHTTDGWHIDHITPLASAKTEEELKSLCHYTNLQPLWAKDNLSKGDKINKKYNKKVKLWKKKILLLNFQNT